jgi:acyl phosphate:glycerol-3-phosphate acyltransferase
MYDGASAYITAVIIGYLVGSVPLAYWIGKYVAKVDIRMAGEGNVGARNVFHVVGHRWGITTFAGDFVKGGALAAIYRNQSHWLVFTAGFALLVGHAWPVWLKFIGGKGLSTVGGFSAMLTPFATAVGGVAALPVWFATRRFIPTLVTAIIVTLVLSALIGVPWQHIAIIVVLFICAGLKRLIDEPRMKRIEESNGWRRIGGVAKPQ